MKKVDSNEIEITKEIEQVKKEIDGSAAEIKKSKTEIDTFSASLKEAYEHQKNAKTMEDEKWNKEKAEIYQKTIRDEKQQFDQQLASKMLGSIIKHQDEIVD